MCQINRAKNRGFTLTELLVALGIFVIVVTPLIVALIKNNKFIIKNKEKLVAESIASKQIEIIRNIPYDNIGTDEYWPHGDIIANPEPETIAGINFQTQVRISFVLDPYDGLYYPADNSPADYKKVEVSCYPVSNPSSKVTLTTDISPRGPGTLTNTGILEIIVFDASGNPVPDADIEITNTGEGIHFLARTLIDGKVFIPELPPADGYHIVVSKTGYSTDQTYPISTENPYPDPQDSSVLLLQLTSVGFAIDLLSSMTVNTVDSNEAAITDPVTFAIHSGKTIGADEDENPIYKYTSTQTTSGGSITFPQIEWDSYVFELSEGSEITYSIMEGEPLQPVNQATISLPPGDNLNYNLILAPK